MNKIGNQPGGYANSPRPNRPDFAFVPNTAREHQPKPASPAGDFRKLKLSPNAAENKENRPGLKDLSSLVAAKIQQGATNNNNTSIASPPTNTQMDTNTIAPSSSPTPTITTPDQSDVNPQGNNQNPKQKRFKPRKNRYKKR